MPQRLHLLLDPTEHESASLALEANVPGLGQHRVVLDACRLLHLSQPWYAAAPVYLSR